MVQGWYWCANNFRSFAQKACFIFLSLVFMFKEMNSLPLYGIYLECSNFFGQASTPAL